MTQSTYPHRWWMALIHPRLHFIGPGERSPRAWSAQGLNSEPAPTGVRQAQTGQRAAPFQGQLQSLRVGGLQSPRVCAPHRASNRFATYTHTPHLLRWAVLPAPWPFPAFLFPCRQSTPPSWRSCRAPKIPKPQDWSPAGGSELGPFACCRCHSLSPFHL